MKMRLAVTTALALGLAGTAQADTTYKPGDSVTVLQSDTYKLTIGGRLQVQYEYQKNDDSNAAGAAGASVDRADLSSFRLRRMYVWMKGYAFTRDLTYKMQADMKDPQLVDTFLNYRFMDELQLQLGQDVMPFCRQELNSSATLQLVERSQANTWFTPSYDTGATFWGKVAGGLVTYQAGVYNGVGQNRRRATTAPAPGSASNAYNLRLAVNPLGDWGSYAESDVEGTASPLLSVGGAYHLNRLAQGGTTGTGAAGALEANTTPYATGFLSARSNATNGGILGIRMFEVDLAFKWMGIYAQGEYFSAKAEAGNLAGKPKLEATGWYAQAGYMVLPQTLEIAARYGSVDPNTASAAKNDALTEITGGVNYFHAKQNAKLQLAVSQLKNEATKVEDLRFQVQAQVVF